MLALQKRIYSQKGNRIPVLLGLTPLNGVRKKGSAFVLDLTERKRDEEAAIRLAAIVEGSEDAIIGIDRKGIVTSWNPGAERLYGYSSAEMIGQLASKLFPPVQINEFQIEMEQILRGERIPPYETLRLRKKRTVHQRLCQCVSG